MAEILGTNPEGPNVFDAPAKAMPEGSPLTAGQQLVDMGTPDANYEQGVLKWINEMILEGESILKDDPGYDEMEKAIQYVMGEQMDKYRPIELSNTPDNRLKVATNQTVAGLTDIHPLFGFRTYNPQFKTIEDVLVKLSQAWWVNNFCDLVLGEIIKDSAVAGTGYCEVAWDSKAQRGTGDIVLRRLDPRDVIPIRPVITSSIQDWDGVILRTAKPPDELRARFPEKYHRISADNTPSVMIRAYTRAKRALAAVISPSAVDFNATQNKAKTSPRQVPTAEVRTIYIKDRSLHIGANPRIMGDPTTTWSYTVYPVDYPSVPDGMDNQGKQKYRRAAIEDAKLYPRGRMIIATKSTILYDGPNPYWHGMFPIAKLCLDPWPWSMLGAGLVRDLIPIQDALNEVLGGILDHVRKLLRPALVADKKVTANSTWERLDTRLPGGKYRVPMGMGGKALDFVSPEPLPEYTFEVLKFLTSEIDFHAGTANLQALAQLQQVPGENTIEKLQEAMSPVLRLKGRYLEYFLRDLGEMVKCNLFQFYDMPRRVMILGQAGIVFNDFDFDPNVMVPAMSSQIDGPNFIPQLDKSRPRAERAQWFHKNFTFSITPNSLLAISQVSRKLMYMQLRSLGLMDRWTLYDVLEIPNGGTPPGDPQTITDRLLTEQLVFAPPAPPMGGRPPTFQKSPTMQQKKQDDGVTPRQTISASGSGGPRPGEGGR